MEETCPPENACKEMHGSEEDEEKLDEPHARRADIQALRNDTANSIEYDLISEFPHQR
jgi:hypothetical protein